MIDLKNHKIIMKHVICTALVIVGLIFQPFAYARPASAPGGRADNSIMMTQMMASRNAFTTDNHSMDMGSDQKPIACHETEQSASGMDDCDGCCNTGCAMIAHCTNTSSVTLAVLQFPHTLPELDSGLFESRAIPLSSAVYTFPIYHPPIYS
jgi:hypothetical protein